MAHLFMKKLIHTVFIIKPFNSDWVKHSDEGLNWTFTSVDLGLIIHIEVQFPV